MMPDDRLKITSDICKFKWPRSFFTPIVMVDWLLEKSQRSWEELIDLGSFKEYLGVMMKTIDEAKEEELRHLWDCYTGVCTSWAVSIALDEGQIDGSVYAFGHKDNHRVAWHQDGIVIDSSAREVFKLEPEGDKQIKTAADGFSWEMKHIGAPEAVLCSGKSATTMREFRRLSGHVEAMRCCLKQIIKKKGPVKLYSLYRAIVDEELRFNGVFVWELLPDKAVISTSEYNREEKTVTIKAVFSKSRRPTQKEQEEQEEEQADLQGKFHNFGYRNGRRKQTELIESISNTIWNACFAVHGEPVYEIGNQKP